MRKTQLTDHVLSLAVSEMSNGLIDAELGGGVIKKRIAVRGRGKSGGVRTLVVTNKGECWFFVFGFAKHVRTNITDIELKALQQLATDLLQLDESQVAEAVEDGSLQEVCH